MEKLSYEPPQAVIDSLEKLHVVCASQNGSNDNYDIDSFDWEDTK